MTAFLVRRVGLGLVFLFIVSIMLFLMLHMIPGDPTVVALGPRSTPEMREAFREMMGLDRPLIEQIGSHIVRLSALDLG